MSYAQSQFSALKQAADPTAADAIARLVEKGADHELNRINVIDFSRANGLDEERAISTFLHAARLGLFDLGWNVLCPGCGGVLGAHSTLKALKTEDYHCALCACGYKPNVDDQVEVSFTVNPRVRRIAAHDPDTLPVWDYYKQMYWSSGVDFTEESVATLANDVTLATRDLPRGESATIALQLPKEFVIVFEPLTHAALFIDVQGEPTGEPQELSIAFGNEPSPTKTISLRPGLLNLTLKNQSSGRALPAVFIAAEALHHLIGRRKPFLTAKRMLSNQTFRDVFKADTLNIDQRLQITSLTFLFTDLKGSTALYERVGDLTAFELVRAHFHALLEIIASEKGAVVKTIGDAVMATFVRPVHAINAGLRMRTAMDALNRQRGTTDLIVKIGIHEGPCLAVMLNERQDYFGQTVNIAARVQSLSTAQEIHITGPVLEAPAVADLLRERAIEPIQKQAALRGIADKIVVYEIP